MNDFKKIVRNLTLDTIQRYFRHLLPTVDMSMNRIIIAAAEVEFIVNQIVLDVLSNMYLANSEKISRYKYYNIMCELLGEPSHEAIEKMLERACEKELKIRGTTEWKENSESFGKDPERSKDFKQKRTIVEWDYIYYRYKSDLITAKQYQRNFTTYRSCEDFVRAQVEYNRAVTMLLPTDLDNDKVYFEKCIRFYYLESHRRIDFMYKFAEIIYNAQLSKINKGHFLVKRFNPIALIPTLNSNTNALEYKEEHRYYRPLLMFEQDFLKNLIWLDDEEVYHTYKSKMEMIQSVRAITYELAIYHYEFAPYSYPNIADFIRNDYPLVDFHESNSLWKEIEEAGWKDAGEDLKRKARSLKKNIKDINNALFWKSNLRQPRTRQDKTQNKD